ncbi:MAG: hypothetical protein GEV12_22995 [Micromonosporaceae bacterium]|nr:hypothetical protein [Micromonosporaceae bacterium]
MNTTTRRSLLAAALAAGIITTVRGDSMSFATDDLASIMVKPDQEHTGYGQGILRAWNSDTGENEVAYRGAVLHNLPTLAGIDQLTWQSGDVVLLMRWQLRQGGAATYWIAGRVNVAGSTERLAFMRTALAKEIANEIAAETFHADTITDSELIGDDIYDDLGTLGPTVAGVEVGASGKMIVFPSVSLLVAANAGDNFSAAAYMSYQISGPTSVAPSDERAARLTLITTDQAGQVTTRTGGAFVHTGLTPGTYQVRAKYRVEIGDENQASANDRTLVVIGL